MGKCICKGCEVNRHDNLIFRGDCVKLRNMKPERAIYVHFEGMDLAGKTTAAKDFVAQTKKEWELRRNSIVKNNPIYRLADQLRLENAYDPEVLGNLYVAALLADVKVFQWPDRNTVQDSTILLRSLAVHTVLATPRIKEALLDLVPEHPKFDHSFVFVATLETRLKRLKQRLQDDPGQVSFGDLMVRNDSQTFLKMEECLVHYAQRIFGSMLIDTSSLAQEGIIDKIAGEVRIP